MDTSPSTNDDDLLRITGDLAIPLREVVLRASRSSGPGGQHANVTASRIEAIFEIAASETLAEWQKARLHGRFGPRVVAIAQDARSQARNRELALERLRLRIADGLTVQAPRTKTRPSRAERERRLTAKRKQSQAKARRRRPPED